MKLVDTHAHLDDNRFASDLTEVINRAQTTGLTHILSIGIDRETSEAAIKLADQFEMIYAVVGIQPNHVHEIQPGDWERILELQRHPKVVALGETGLDRYWDKAPFDLQEIYFRKHLAQCRENQLPVVIHLRDAEADMVRVLRSEYDQSGPIRGVMHSFSGNQETAQACLEMGLMISFAGMVTFKNNPGLREVAKGIPLDRILIETDSPYLAPQAKRGRRNEPAYVLHTAECLAELFQISTEEFARITSENAINLFQLKNESQSET